MVADLSEARKRIIDEGSERLGQGVLFFTGERLCGKRSPLVVQLVEDAVEDRKVKRLVGQFAGVGDPSNNIRLQHRHVSLNGVLMQDSEGGLRQFASPLPRSRLSGKQTNKL